MKKEDKKAETIAPANKGEIKKHEEEGKTLPRVTNLGRLKTKHMLA
jgi:hypothetical protein